jgi:predicted acetyltransferase
MRPVVDHDDALARSGISPKKIGNRGLMPLEFRRPHRQLAASFAEMRDAFLAMGDDRWSAASSHSQKAIAHSDVDGYVKLLNDWARGENLPNGWVPGDEFWIVNDGRVVGELRVRHRLTDWLRQMGGHIGFLVHPDFRNQGIATFALREGVKVVALLGEPEALVTCAEDNAASARVIDKCGGVRIADSMLEGFTKRRRYVIAAGLTRTITSERLTLEPLTEHHADSLFPVLSDPALWTYAGEREEERAPQSLQTLRDLYRRFEVRRADNGKYLLCSWAVLNGGNPIGFVIGPFDPLTRRATLGYVIGRPWWSKGFATEAVSVVVSHFIANGGRHVRAMVDRGNVASLRVLVKCGFSCEDRDARFVDCSFRVRCP